jgi:hypothetical protein
VPHVVVLGGGGGGSKNGGAALVRWSGRCNGKRLETAVKLVRLEGKAPVNAEGNAKPLVVVAVTATGTTEGTVSAEISYSVRSSVAEVPSG